MTEHVWACNSGQYTCTVCKEKLTQATKPKCLGSKSDRMRTLITVSYVLITNGLVILAALLALLTLLKMLGFR